MYFYDLVYPGSRVGGPDRNAAFEAEILLGELDSSLLDVAISLSLFEESEQKLLATARESSAPSDRARKVLHRLPFIYAQSFLHALHGLRKVLGVLATSEAPSGLDKVRLRFDSSFPDLKGVRDSTQHIEERLLGQAKGKPIQAPIRWIGNLSGNRFEMTMENGQVGGVEISKASLDVAGSCVQGAIECFEWTGPGSEARSA